MDKEFIERKALLDRYDAEHVGLPGKARELIATAPAADVAPVVHGRWIPTLYPFMAECEDCSNCGYRTVYGNDYPYCPNCGAKMDKEATNELDKRER